MLKDPWKFVLELIVLLMQVQVRNEVSNEDAAQYLVNPVTGTECRTYMSVRSMHLFP